MPNENNQGFYDQNKYYSNYAARISSRKSQKKVRNTHKIRKKKKSIKKSVKSSEGGFEGCFTVASLLLTGSAIMSTLPSEKGKLSISQSVSVSEGSISLGHHVYHKSKGWLKQAACVKPLIDLYSWLDMRAYKALGLKPPIRQYKLSRVLS